METKYIVAIVALSLFFVLFLIFFILLAHRRKTEAKLQAWLNEIYSDSNLVKVDYESASDEDEEMRSADNTEKPVAEQLAESQEVKEEQQGVEETFSKIEVEGIEEITGNYELGK